MTKLNRKLSIRVLVALLVFVTLAFLSLNIVEYGIAYAETNLKFDNTSIFDDLYGSKDEHGNEFDLGNYPKDKDGELRFYTFVEYGYSYYANLDKNYALYMYLYNPQQLDFSTYLDSNVVRMATAFAKNSEREYVASDYDDFNIVCVSRTTGDYANLFYKFKILDPEKKLLALAQKYESENGCRRYDIAGVYLKTDKGDVTLDKNIGRSFKCSGYMATYGENANNPSTFVCKVDVLETLDLKVYQTSYLTGVSSAGAYHHNNVSSVYFAIPQRVFDKYGSLWEIYAQWYECKTAPILVTSNQDFYQKALSNNHYETIDNDKKLAMPFFAIEELIYDFVFSRFVNLYKKYRYLRGDNTLLMYVLKSICAKIHSYYTGIYNRFSYIPCDIALEAGVQDGKMAMKKYYLMTKKIYSKRFSTDCFSEFFTEKTLKSWLGLDDLAEFKTEKASFDEMLQENSYFFEDLCKMLKSDKNKQG